VTPNATDNREARTPEGHSVTPNATDNREALKARTPEAMR
jgi:hypothetical protein